MKLNWKKKNARCLDYVLHSHKKVSTHSYSDARKNQSFFKMDQPILIRMKEKFLFVFFISTAALKRR